MTTATFPERLFAPTGGEAVTLDDLVVDVLENLAIRERARCPICAGDLLAAGPGESRCDDCGSGLS